MRGSRLEQPSYNNVRVPNVHVFSFIAQLAKMGPVEGAGKFETSQTWHSRRYAPSVATVEISCQDRCKVIPCILFLWSPCGPGVGTPEPAAVDRTTIKRKHRSSKSHVEKCDTLAVRRTVGRSDYATGATPAKTQYSIKGGSSCTPGRSPWRT